MANNKTFNTRISLKYDTLTNWNASTFTLLSGEVACVQVPAQTDVKGGLITAPQLLFKVGDGQHMFRDLNWASGLAADVYAWAKAEHLEWSAANQDNFLSGLSSYIDDRIGEAGLTAITAGEGLSVTTPTSGNVTVGIKSDWANALSGAAVTESEKYTDTVSGLLKTAWETADATVSAATLKAAKDYTDVVSTAIDEAYKAADAQVLTNAKAYTNTVSAANHTAWKAEWEAADTTILNSAKTYVNEQISALDVPDTAETGKFVTQVVETDGKIAVTRAALVSSDIPALPQLKVEGLETALNGKADAADLTEEIARATSKEGELNTAITTEASTARAAEVALGDRIDGAEDDIEALEDRVATLETGASGLDDRLTTAESNITELDGRLDTAESSITTLQTNVSGLDDRLDTAEGDIDAVEGRMATAEGNISNLQTNKADTSALTTETNRATSAETALGNRITALEGADQLSALTGRDAIDYTNANHEISLKLNNSDEITLSQDGTGLKAVAGAGLSGNATIATVADGVVTIRAGVKEEAGKIAQGAGSDITLAKVATTGKAADVSVEKTGNLSSFTGNLQETLSGIVDSIEKGGTGSVVTLSSTTEDLSATILKKYTIYQGGTAVGDIDIPKDLVVTSGSIVKGTWTGDTFVESQDGPHKALKLMIANQTTPVYINVRDLCDVYTAQENATQVQLAISDTNVISAEIVDGSIGTDELAANAVTTAKIADGNVTVGKLDSALALSVANGNTALKNIGTWAKPTQLTSDTITGAIAELASGDAISAAIQTLDAEVTGNVSTIASPTSTSAFNVVTGVTVTEVDGKLSAATVQEKTLAKVAETGNVNDVVQTDGDFLYLNCGSASTIINPLS